MGKFNTADYPRPDFVRENWVSLNGEWDFSFDTEIYDRKIIVPFVYQCKSSGIDEQTHHETVWYRRKFTVDAEKISAGAGRLLLKFGAVDYEANVYINGSFVGDHYGGYTPFAFDITDYIQDGENELKVKVTDGQETDKPRGKQTWYNDPFGCWYTASTGIWQDVWLEYTGSVYIKRIKITPDLNRNQALLEVFLSGPDCCRADATVTVDSVKTGEQYHFGASSFECRNGYGKCIIAFPDMDLTRDRFVWSLEYPNLIYVNVKLQGSEAKKDEVLTYFGMRSIEFRNNRFYLNGQIYLQRLVLDQGYWPDSLYTPPGQDALKKDISLTKEMGFNGVRKHQKIESPHFYYWADRMGLLVWGELPSPYMFNDNMIKSTANTMIEFIERDFNHPSIVTWVPVNESWGVRSILTETQQQAFSDMMIFLIKSMDPTRTVSGNDGWEQTSNTDILAIHDYAIMPDTVHKYDDMKTVIQGEADVRKILADGQQYNGQPVMMTEYGGIAFEEAEDGWGYFGKVKDEEAFLKRLAPVTEYLMKSGQFAGFCYTQLTDVMQEKNGLLYEDRIPKVSVQKLRRVFANED